MSDSEERLTLKGPDLPSARSAPAKARHAKLPKSGGIPAPDFPVARVAVDIPLPHLDRPFDYLVTENMHEQVVVGCRVKVRFAGQLVGGLVLDRLATSSHDGKLTPIARVVSSEPVLTPEIARLARAVADRYSGTLSDVMRLAIPPRNAFVELSPEPTAAPRTVVELPDSGGLGSPWCSFTNGPQFLAALASGRSPRAVWSALPGPSWPAELAHAVAAVAASGRGALIVVPDRRDVDRVDTALTDVLGSDQHVVLTADLGPRERYRRWLAIRRGQVGIVLGTRAAAFAPVADLGLSIVWDDGDDLHSEPRAPYPHVREVLALRAHLANSGLLIVGFTRTAEAASLVGSGFARSVVSPRPIVKACAPAVRATADGGFGDDPLQRAARLPHLAWRVAQESLKTGPVLIQVPRGGYIPSVSCTRCHTRADCVECQGPLALAAAAAAAVCRWCATAATDWRCATCGHDRMRAQVIGARRTAEELGRAFPSIPVVTSGGESVIAGVSDRPALVIATPGGEPVAKGGYPAALLLDTWALLERSDLRATEETLRRWMTAAALVRAASDGGQVVVVADASLRPVQALVRWDPVGHAARELEDRAAAGLPPAMRVAELVGAPTALADFLVRSELPIGASVLGPTVRADGMARAVIRIRRADGPQLAAALRRTAGERSAHKEPDLVSVRIDPLRLG